MNPINQISQKKNGQSLIHIVGLVVSVAIGAVAYQFGYVPAKMHDQRVRQEAQTLSKDLAGIVALRDKRSKLQQELETVNAARPTNLIVADRADDAEFLQSVSSIADELNITIDDYKRGNITDFDAFAKLNITVDFQSNYDSICKFFNRISELPMVVKVNRLQVNSQSKAGKYSVTIEFGLVFHPQNNQQTIAQK